MKIENQISQTPMVLIIITYMDYFQNICFLFHIWHVEYISNYIPQFTVGCNYLALPEIPASGDKVLIYIILNHDWQHLFNSLTTGRCYNNFKSIISTHMLWIKFMSTEIPLTWMSQNAFDDKSTLVQVMAWCQQAKTYYSNQCWSDLWHHMVSPGHNELKTQNCQCSFSASIFERQQAFLLWKRKLYCCFAW